jgi:hypothetical protein
MLELLIQLAENEYFVWCAMALIIFISTQILKLPIKACTKHIKRERARKIANATILLIPFGLGVLCDFLYCTYYLHTVFSVITGLGYGTAGISLYGVIERFFKVKVANPYETEQGQSVLALVGDIKKDGKVDKQDVNAIQEFYNKVK